jgi:glycosyltransferase involved in cell wall biosynthesis
MLPKIDLIILKNTYFQSKQDLNIGKYKLFSQRMDGEIFQRVSNPELERFTVGDFKFKGVLINKWLGKFKLSEHLTFFFACVFRAMAKRIRGEKVQYILATDPQSSGVIAWIVSRIIGAKLVIEMNGNSGARKTWGAQGSNWVGHLKYQYCQRVIPFIMRRSFAVKLLYPQQLEPFERDVSHPNLACFHEYVPISDLNASNNNDEYILFLGMPWHVKGLDLLIKAFNKVGTDYRGHLKIVGYLSGEDRAFIESLIDGNEKIVITPPVYYEEAQQLIHNCDFLVLPSRTEAMGRVLLEAMAHKKALIGSSADGIPFYLLDNKYGLIFDSGNADDLADKLAIMIGNPELKCKFAENGRHAAVVKYSEDAYLENYLNLLQFKKTK